MSVQYFKPGSHYRFSTYSGDVLTADVQRGDGLRVSIRFRNEETAQELHFLGDSNVLEDDCYIFLEPGDAEPVTRDDVVLFACEHFPSLPVGPDDVFKVGRCYVARNPEGSATWFFRFVKREDFTASGFVYSLGGEPLFSSGDLFNINGREVIYFNPSVCPLRFDCKEFK